MEKDVVYTRHYYKQTDKVILQCEEWRCGRKLYREDGPAKIWYYKDGSIHYEEWYCNGGRHKIDGPGQINYHRNNGGVSHIKWVLNGYQYRCFDVWLTAAMKLDNPPSLADQVRLKLEYL